MRLHHGYAVTAFAIASVINPGYFVGCVSTDEPDFKYGAKEMAALVAAANDSFEFEQAGTRYRIDVELAPKTHEKQARRAGSPFAQLARACGDRKLVATAEACVDSSSMDVAGHFTLLKSADGEIYQVVASDIALQGSLYVSSLVLNMGTLELGFEDGTLSLHSPDAKSFNLAAYNLGSLVNGAVRH